MTKPKANKLMHLELAEVQELEPGPLAPPGSPAVPRLPSRLPLTATEGPALKLMVVEALDVQLPPDDLDVVLYLIRRAHGQGWSESRNR